MPVPRAAIRSIGRCALLVAALLATMSASLLGVGRAQNTADPIAVAALFAERCTMCHGGAAPTLGLDLGDLKGALRGSDRGPVVVPGDPEASELVMRLRGTSQPRMPLTGPPYLSDEQIERVVDWIAAGAPTGSSDDAEPEDVESDATEGATSEVDDEPARPQPGSFPDVASILSGRCAYCHQPDGVLGPAPEGLVLTSHASILAGGDRIVIVPGTPLASELYRRVAGIARPRMPFDGPPWLSDDEIERIRAWIEAGAPDPDGKPAGLPVGDEIRLEGTLTGRWAIDGLPLVVTSATRIDDDPSVGDLVEVRAVVASDGSIRATRVRQR